MAINVTITYAGVWDRGANQPRSHISKQSNQDLRSKYDPIAHDHSKLRWLCIVYKISRPDDYSASHDDLIARLVAYDQDQEGQNHGVVGTLANTDPLADGAGFGRYYFDVDEAGSTIKTLREWIFNERSDHVDFPKKDIRLVLGSSTKPVILPDFNAPDEGTHRTEYGDRGWDCVLLYRLVDHGENKFQQVNLQGPQADVHQKLMSKSRIIKPLKKKNTTTSTLPAQVPTATQETTTRKSRSPRKAIDPPVEADFVPDDESSSNENETAAGRRRGGQISPGKAPYKPRTPEEDSFPLDPQAIAELQEDEAELVTRSPVKKRASQEDCSNVSKS